jgi:Bacteriocin-protection, YdeI or OmpD-Associated/Domain of unknown function (DUF1905)
VRSIGRAVAERPSTVDGGRRLWAHPVAQSDAPNPGPACDTQVMKFRTTLQRFGGNNTGIEVPEEVLVALGRGRRVKVVATVNGYTYRTSIAPAMGKILMPFSSGHRAASGLSGGEGIEVEVVPDDAPREVEVPVDLGTALADAPEAASFFAGLSYTHQRSYVLWVEDAKKAETRWARVAKAVEMLSDHRVR